MMNKYVKYFLLLLAVAGLGYAMQSLLLHLFDLQLLWEQVDYSLIGLYTFFSIASVIFVVLLCASQFAMPKAVGLIFLVGVFLLAIASYVYIQGGLGLFENRFVELNFIAAFFVFLFYNVYVAYDLVNQGEKTVEK